MEGLEKNAVIYARYSSAGQRDQSIEDQVNACKKFAENNGYKIIKIYADHAKTGRNDDREEFQKMLSDSASGAFKTVLLWKLDRFGRNREEMTINKMKLKKNNVKVVSVMENIPETSEGVILEALMEGMAEYYSLNLSENVKRGMSSNAKKAIYNGGTVAYGFKIVDQRFKIEPAEAEVVRWVFERFTKGYTRKEIVDLLKEKDIRTKRGNDFTVGAITRLLKNRKYMGDYKFDDTVVEGAIEPIVDKSVFEEAQKLLKARMKNKHAKENCHYLFSGKIVCAHCKQNYIADSGTSRNGTVHKYYTCRGKKIHNGCKNKNFKKDELEDLILSTTLNDVLTSETIPKIAKHTVKALKHSRETDTALKVLEKDLKETLKRRDNIMQAIEMGVVTDSTLSRLKELEDKIAELTTKIELEKNKKPLPTVEAVEWYLYDFSTANLTDEHDRQKLTNMLIKKIVVDDNLVTIIYNSYDYRHSLECSDMTFMVHLENVKLNQVVYLDPYTFCYSFHIKTA